MNNFLLSGKPKPVYSSLILNGYDNHQENENKFRKWISRNEILIFFHNFYVIDQIIS